MLKLHDIIKHNESNSDTLLIELLLKRKKQLLAYYEAYFTSEPVLMVTSVMNAAQYGKIVAADELNEALETYIESTSDELDTPEDKENYKEEILFNSILFKDL